MGPQFSKRILKHSYICLLPYVYSFILKNLGLKHTITLVISDYHDKVQYPFLGVVCIFVGKEMSQGVWDSTVRKFNHCKQ